MKKRNIILGSSIMLALLLIAGGTMAWFTAEADDVINNFKAGTVGLKINDRFDKEAAKNVNPGDSYEKVINITNEGTKKAYVRVKLTPKFEGDLATGVVTYPELANWVLHTDGWYYYKNVVDAGMTTTNLIEEVIFAGADMDNTYQGAGFTLTVEAEAIQSTNGAALDAWGIDPATL